LEKIREDFRLYPFVAGEAQKWARSCYRRLTKPRNLGGPAWRDWFPRRWRKQTNAIFLPEPHIPFLRTNHVRS